LFITAGIMISFLLGLLIPANPITSYTPTIKDGACIPPLVYAQYSETWLNDWRVTQYWRFMFGLPIIFSLIQVTLLLTVFKYDTPKALKQRKENEKLHKLMTKIYEEEEVKERIEAIII
jgi:hypothetical protein